MIDINYGFAFLIFIVIISFFLSSDWKKYKKNTPYTPTKKKNTFHRIILGLIAGIHYSHFIGTYNHKKYNTQVFTPETLECYIGGSFAAILYLAYFAIADYFKTFIGIYGLSVLLIPIITNIVSFAKK